MEAYNVSYITSEIISKNPYVANYVFSVVNPNKNYSPFFRQNQHCSDRQQRKNTDGLHNNSVDCAGRHRSLCIFRFLLRPRACRWLPR